MACDREQTRTTLQSKMDSLGPCDQAVAADRATCLEQKAALARDIAALYASAAPAKSKSAKAVRSNTNRLELEVEDE